LEAAFGCEFADFRPNHDHPTSPNASVLDRLRVYRAALHGLHDVIELNGRFETTASRMLIDAIKPT
jgi:hypothetical protein